MAYSHGVQDITLPAAADLSTKQFHAIKVNSSGQAAAIAAITDAWFGVLQDKPSAAGNPGCIKRHGISKMVAGAATTAGSPVYLLATGRVSGTATSTAKPVGIALESATTDGDIIPVDLVRIIAIP